MKNIDFSKATEYELKQVIRLANKELNRRKRDRQMTHKIISRNLEDVLKLSIESASQINLR